MNIILIISDTFRYDNLFNRAIMPVNTPNLDKFSERAVSIDNFYTGSFPTIPQRTDLTTGRVGWPWYGWQNLTYSGKNNIPDILGLSEKEYVSQLLCDCPHLFNTGFQHNFTGAFALRGQEGDLPFLRMNYPIQEVMPANKTRKGRYLQAKNLVDIHKWTNQLWRGEEDRFPPRTSRLAVEWLEENYQYNPFFLWVDFFDPHEPWDAPEYMVKKYDPEYTGIPMLHPNYGRSSDYTSDELKNLHAHYCAEAELVDRWVGRVIQKIDDLSLWDNSIVVFTSDHGMSIGEHDRTGKSNISEGDDRYWPVYPEIAHIPFMIAAPGLKGGQVIDTMAQPADILPTLLDLCGLDVEPPDPFHGKSFAPQLQGDSKDSIRNIAVAASFLRKEEGSSGMPPCKSVTPVVYTDKWAYVPIGSEGEPELFDLLHDPYAENNIAYAHSKEINNLHNKFIEWLKEINAPKESMVLFERMNQL